MRKYNLVTSSLALTLFLAFGAAFGQDGDTLPVGAVRERAVAASPSISAVRPAGDLRIWTFHSQGTQFGILSSQVKAGGTIDGRPSLAFEEQLDLDYTKIKADRHDHVTGSTSLANDGAYLGTDWKIGPEDSAETLELRRVGGKIDGYFTRAGQRNDISIAAGRDIGVWETNFLDQLEAKLALMDLNIGKVIDDSVVSPQSLIKSKISGQVIYFMWQEIYKGRIDSVFIIHIDRPFEGMLYFTPDKRLVRTDFVNQKVRAYQDVVQAPRVEQPAPTQTETPRAAPTFTWRVLIFKLPYYLAFAMVALVGMLMFSWEAFRRGQSYLFLIVGMLIYLFIPNVQNPIIIRVVAGLLPEGGISGGAAYGLALVAPVIGAVFQAALILGALLGLFSIVKPKTEYQVGLAVFLAGGFAVVEACYMNGLALRPLIGWDGLGQMMLVLFHVATGALIGGAIRLGPKHLVPALLVAALVNMLIRYLPFLPQQRVLDVEVVHMMMAVIVLAYIASVLLLLRRLRA